jgi:hypothetical protein
MSNSQNRSTNSSFVSIRYPSSSKELSDAAKQLEQGRVPAIDLEALRSLKRIVETIRNRIDGAERNDDGNDSQPFGAGASGGPKTDRANCGTDSHGEETKSK